MGAGPFRNQSIGAEPLPKSIYDGGVFVKINQPGRGFVGINQWGWRLLSESANGGVAFVEINHGGGAFLVISQWGWSIVILCQLGRDFVIHCQRGRNVIISQLERAFGGVAFVGGSLTNISQCGGGIRSSNVAVFLLDPSSNIDAFLKYVLFR